jgi:hypothetical protein
MIRRKRPDEDGISEVIGYVVILATILISTGLVLGQGIPALQQHQDTEHFKNTQQTFGIVQNNLNELVDKQVPARATEMRIRDSTLHTKGKVHIGYNESGPPVSGDFGESRVITYDTSENKLVYENGAVIASSSLSSENGSAMIREPMWSLGQANPSVNAVDLSVEGKGDVRSGGGTAQIRGDRMGARTKMSDHIYLSIDSPNADAWARYFERSEAVVAIVDDPREGATGTDGLPRVTAKIEASDMDVVYTKTNIQVEIE